MNFISKIEKPDSKQKVKTKKYLDSLVKPIGSLGRLEDFAVKLSGITGKMHNDLFKKAIVVFGADNGVWDEGVTPVPQSVTDIQMRNMDYQRIITGSALCYKYAINCLFA